MFAKARVCEITCYYKERQVPCEAAGGTGMCLCVYVLVVVVGGSWAGRLEEGVPVHCGRLCPIPQELSQAFIRDGRIGSAGTEPPGGGVEGLLQGWLIEEAGGAPVGLSRGGSRE